MFIKTKEQCRIIRDDINASGCCFVADDLGNVLFNVDDKLSDKQIWETFEIARKAFQCGQLVNEAEYEKVKTKALKQNIYDLKVQLHEKERSEKLLRAVYEISELTSNSSLEIDDFYKQIHEIVGDLVDASNFYICKIDASERNLDFVYYRDCNHYGEGAAMHPSREISDGYTELVIRSGSATLLSRKEMEDFCITGVTKRRVGISNSWLGVPLSQSDKIIGVIAVQSYVEGFMYSDADVHLLNFVSQHVSTAIKRRDIVEFERQKRMWLEHAAEHDELTKLPNRAAINSLINTAINDSRCGKQNAFSILFIDLDGFKQVNDSFGHHVGDALLKVVANKLKSIIRTGDKVGRLGGDEFILLLHDMVSKESAYEIADRIISDFARPLKIEDCEVLIGASIGIAFSNSGYQNVDEIIKAADAAMYKAKSLGKNRYQEFV